MVLLSPSLPSQHRAGKWTRYPSCPVATSRQFSLSPPKILSCNPDKNHKAWVSHHMGSDRGNMHRELATSSMGPGECPRHFQSKASLWIGWDLQEIHHLLHPASVWLKVSEEEPTTMLTEKALYLWLFTPLHCGHPPHFPFFLFPSFLGSYSKPFTSSSQLLLPHQHSQIIKLLHISLGKWEERAENFTSPTTHLPCFYRKLPPLPCSRNHSSNLLSSFTSAGFTSVHNGAKISPFLRKPSDPTTPSN